MTEPKTEIDRRLDRIELAISKLAEHLVDMNIIESDIIYIIETALNKKIV